MLHKSSLKMTSIYIRKLKITVRNAKIRHPLLCLPIVVGSNKFAAQKFFENDEGNPCLPQKLLSETLSYGTLSPWRGLG